MDIPTCVSDLRKYAPEELRNMCTVLHAILAFCEDSPRERRRDRDDDDDLFDADELGLDPDEDVY